MIPSSGIVCEYLEGFIGGFSTTFIEFSAQPYKTRAIWKYIEPKFYKTKTKFGIQCSE